MKYKKIVRLYSNSRVAKYYRATSGDKNKAVMLYFANMKIAQAFHPLLSSFEVILQSVTLCPGASFFGRELDHKSEKRVYGSFFLDAHE